MSSWHAPDRPGRMASGPAGGQGWLHALRTLRDNPLPGLWATTSRRRAAGNIFRPASFLKYILLGSLCVELGTYLFQRVMLGLHAWLIEITMLLGLLWVLLELWSCLHLAFGFLGRETRTASDQSVNELLAGTLLTATDLLLAIQFHILRRMWLPILLLAISIALSDGSEFMSPIALLTQTPWLALILFGSSLLALACLSMLAVRLGSVLQGQSAVTLASSLTVLLQAAIVAGWFLGLHENLHKIDNLEEYRVIMMTIAQSFSILLFLLLGLGCRGMSQGRKRRLSDPGGLLLTALLIGLALFIIVNCMSLTILPSSMLRLAVTCLMPLSIANMDIFLAWQTHYDERQWLALLPLHPLAMLLWQVAYLTMFSQFALDAVRRRKWGDA